MRRVLLGIAIAACLLARPAQAHGPRPGPAGGAGPASPAPGPPRNPPPLPPIPPGLPPTAPLDGRAPTATKPVPPPPRTGIRWEDAFDAGLRRAVDEGRPVFIAVNALVDAGETGNLLMWRETYASPEMGAATRSFVNFVANLTEHAVDRAPDGAVTCRRYGRAPCAVHQDAMRFVTARFASPDGAIISPYHAILDPDLKTVFFGEYMQSCPTPDALDGWLVALSPSHALRDVSTAREVRLTALERMPTTDLEAAASDWVATRDAMAAPGLVVLLDAEKIPARRAALFAALAKAGPLALSSIERVIDAATTDPDIDRDAVGAWIDVALKIDVAYGVHAAARAIHRTKDGVALRRWHERAESAADAIEGPEGALAIAYLLEGRVEKNTHSRFADVASRTKWPVHRVDRTLRAGAKLSVEGVATMERDALRSALFEAAFADRAVNVTLAVRALARPEDDVRVAAALALRVAGDYRGADLLKAAISDPIEGPEVRAVLARVAGKDLGDDREAWADVLTAPAKGSD